MTTHKRTPHHSDDRTHIGEHKGTHGGGKPPKPKFAGQVTVVHGQMYHRQDGAHYQSITPTQVAKARAGAVDLESKPLSPEATARRYAPAPIHPSMDSAHVALGNRLLAGVKPGQFETLQDQRRKAAKR
jgi:hypothetical protein